MILALRKEKKKKYPQIILRKCKKYDVCTTKYILNSYHVILFTLSAVF